MYEDNFFEAEASADSITRSPEGPILEGQMTFPPHA